MSFIEEERGIYNRLRKINRKGAKLRKVNAKKKNSDELGLL